MENEGSLRLIIKQRFYNIRRLCIHTISRALQSSEENKTRISYQIGAETFTKVIHLYVRLKYRLIR